MDPDEREVLEYLEALMKSAERLGRRRAARYRRHGLIGIAGILVATVPVVGYAVRRTIRNRAQS